MVRIRAKKPNQDSDDKDQDEDDEAGWQMLRERRSPKGQSLLRKEGPQTYAILLRNLVLSRFTLFVNGHHRAFYESHPSL